MTPVDEPSAANDFSRWLTVSAVLALIGLGLAWELWLAPTGSGTLALKVLPLVACIAGLLRGRIHTFRVLSLLVWLYFMEGVVRATSEAGTGRSLALAEVGLCLVAFAAGTAYIRQRARRAPAA